ncbi:hypothetical protein ACNR9W_011290 [Paracoccus sp. T5]
MLLTLPACAVAPARDNAADALECGSGPQSQRLGLRLIDTHGRIWQ